MSFNPSNMNYAFGSSSTSFTIVRFEQVSIDLNKFKVQVKPKSSIKAAIKTSMMVSTTKSVTRTRPSAKSPKLDMIKGDFEIKPKQIADVLDIKSTVVKTTANNSTHITDKTPNKGALSPIEIDINKQARWDLEDNTELKSRTYEKESETSTVSSEIKQYGQNAGYYNFLRVV